MKALLTTILALISITACHDDDPGRSIEPADYGFSKTPPSSVPAGHFTASGETIDRLRFTELYLCVDSQKHMDSRLRPGQIFISSTDFQTLDGDELHHGERKITLLEVDHAGQQFTRRVEPLLASLGAITITERCTYDPKKNSTFFECQRTDIEPVQDRPTPTLEKDNKKYCYFISEGKSSSEVIAKGTYKFRDGKSVVAYRSETTSQGHMSCTEGDKKTIEESATQTRVSILSNEVPEDSLPGCEKLKSLFSYETTTDQAGRLRNLFRSEELEWSPDK